MKVYLIHEIDWEYNDEYYERRGLSDHVEVFRSREKAIVKLYEMNLQASKDRSITDDSYRPITEFYVLKELDIPDEEVEVAPVATPVATPATMESVLEAKRKVEENIEGLRSQLEKLGADALAAHFKPFFEKHPEVVGIAWTQYTPYFNDGEPCTFDSNHEYANVLITDEDDGVIDEDDVAYKSDEWRKIDSLQKEARELFPKLTNDDLLAMFGDHCKVTIYRNRVEISSYDHD